jgi:hypothetical protein
VLQQQTTDNKVKAWKLVGGMMWTPDAPTTPFLEYPVELSMVHSRSGSFKFLLSEKKGLLYVRERNKFMVCDVESGTDFFQPRRHFTEFCLASDSAKLYPFKIDPKTNVFECTKYRELLGYQRDPTRVDFGSAASSSRIASYGPMARSIAPRPSHSMGDSGYIAFIALFIIIIYFIFR